MGNSAVAGPQGKAPLPKSEGGWYLTDDFWQHYEKLTPLGVGRTCEATLVRKAGVGEVDRTKYACKVIKKGRPTMKAMFVREHKILQRLHHPNCVRLIGAYEDPTHFYIVMTACPGGELFTRIKSGANFNELETCTLVRYMVRSIHHLHSQNIVHRDLKPENCLLDNNERVPNLRLIDFGSAVLLNESASGEKHQELAGTPYYMSPEAVRNIERTGEQLKATDMWSIGVITFVLLSGKPPFGGKTTKEIFNKILSGKLSWPSGCNWSDELKDFLRKCITRNMKKRMKIDDALRHPWFDQIPEPGSVIDRKSVV